MAKNSKEGGVDWKMESLEERKHSSPNYHADERCPRQENHDHGRWNGLVNCGGLTSV